MNTPHGQAAQVAPPAQPGWRALAGEEPPIGAHLMTPRRGYTHHGIYVGQGEVVHYAGLSRRLARGPVERVSIGQFAAGRALFVATGNGGRFDAQDVVRRACSRLGEDCYRLASNNCEHFCTWCCSGESRSEQVERLAGLLRSALRSLQRLVGSTPQPWHARSAA